PPTAERMHCAPSALSHGPIVEEIGQGLCVSGKSAPRKHETERQESKRAEAIGGDKHGMSIANSLSRSASEILPPQEPHAVIRHLCDGRGGRPRESAPRRGFGISGILAALVAFPADAMDANRPCSGLLEEMDREDVSPPEDEQPLLTHNECE